MNDSVKGEERPMTEREKMLSGMLYSLKDKELQELHARSQRICEKFK